jgi:hypothetical protein
MALSNFTPSGYAMMAALWGTSSVQALPGGGGATLVVTNMGPSPAVVLLGGSTATVTPATGMVILAHSTVALAVGSNGYIAAIGTESNATLNLAQGA